MLNGERASSQSLVRNLAKAGVITRQGFQPLVSQPDSKKAPASALKSYTEALRRGYVSKKPGKSTKPVNKSGASGSGLLETSQGEVTSGSFINAQGLLNGSQSKSPPPHRQANITIERVNYAGDRETPRPIGSSKDSASSMKHRSTPESKRRTALEGSSNSINSATSRGGAITGAGYSHSSGVIQGQSSSAGHNRESNYGTLTSSGLNLSGKVTVSGIISKDLTSGKFREGSSGRDKKKLSLGLH